MSSGPLRRFVVASMATAILGTGCDLFTGPSTQSLRIRNTGTIAIEALRVGFVESRTNFGDVPVSASTDYIEVPGGVYSYSSFRFVYQGTERIQPVIDFVGEEPMDGERFTYDVQLILRMQGEPFVTIQNVSRDR